jgi:putative sigma-54 modulation protein
MMDVSIQGRNVRVTQPLEEYAHKKLSRLDRYLPNIQDIRVDLSSENTRRGSDLFSAQITVRHRRGAILRAEEKSASDITTAIDSAIDKMYRRIQRFKGKRSRRGRERFLATIEELDIAEEIPDVEEFIEEYALPEEPDVDLVPDIPLTPIERRKVIELTPMNEAEAIEQMELLGHSFFVFYNAEDSAVNVLYRRDSGGYGILIPNTPA